MHFVGFKVNNMLKLRKVTTIKQWSHQPFIIWNKMMQLLVMVYRTIYISAKTYKMPKQYNTT